jgi:hypothetical protein
MTIPLRLKMGADCPSPAPEEEKERIATLRATVEHYLPEFGNGVAEAVRESKKEGAVMVIHQDAFAAGYDDDEYTLLGMAIKYAGLLGVSVTVTGKNHESF